MINILYFARYRDALDCAGETLDTTTDLSAQELLRQLQQRGEPWQSTLSDKQLIIAVNQEVSDGNCILKDGDEVAFFPPVTGG